MTFTLQNIDLADCLKEWDGINSQIYAIIVGWT